MTTPKNTPVADTMRAVLYDEAGGLRVARVPRPVPGEAEVLVRVRLAGICNTDLEITRGYVPGFSGIPGHEFVGVVEALGAGIDDGGDDGRIGIGCRCTGEINCACGRCDYCRVGMGRHCPHRTVLGIINRNGAFAEYVTVPRENLVLIPDAVSDRDAVFIEPLAAALEILDQVPVRDCDRVLLLGDGKLGLMAAHALAPTGCRLTVVGKHPEKLALLDYDNVETQLSHQFISVGGSGGEPYDIVVEATGSSAAFDTAAANVRPRGTIVLKSTYAEAAPLNLSPLVVNEVTIVGSRCGLFSRAVDFLLNRRLSFENMISDEFPLEEAVRAFDRSRAPGVLKVLLKA